MRGAVVLVGLVLVTLSGCGGEEEPRLGEGRDVAPAPPVGDQSPDERVIREWSSAVNAGEYERAADLFERGALVEQLGEIELTTRDDAIAFNRSLPCRADVTDVKEESSATLAAFNLREGRTGGCEEGGNARVRFVIRDGLIREWRQLSEPAAPPGETAATPRRLL